MGFTIGSGGKVPGKPCENNNNNINNTRYYNNRNLNLLNENMTRPSLFS
jgi:hypothetical protein